MRIDPDFQHEEALRARGCLRVAGIDEVGRGPLAGPVVAAAVILDPARIPPGLHDSKQMTPRTRERAALAIRDSAWVGIGEASVEEIEAHNILRATHLAMCRALRDLGRPVDHALVDGRQVPPNLGCPATGLVRGDSRSLSIAAASIVAKVWRDGIMRALAQQHPGYGWETNMGYGSKSHMAALQALGPTPWHRRTFAPVHKVLWQAEKVSS
ncbi:ribonuclease HII [Rubellimicrobium aerolatum]|uniref:Ribonuclease HII n=1 Tax=Rubellimicrobium aerolatum TaxID=490979 RepID=A0ABW0SAE5_9RHOB|nr:ribonuclease HII [Rubellimicrobium aerolatum]MBP1805272.1 ribonuclease HII [Rubellimicrobium aerolatum]